MYRTRSIIAIVLLGVLMVSAPVAASHGGRTNGRCSIAVDDHLVRPTDAVRMRGEGWPAASEDRFTVVEIHVRHVATHTGSIAWLWLVPGGTWFIYDHNATYDPNEPPLDPMAPGLYRVRAHAEGFRCVARDWFIVREPGRFA